MKFSLAKALLCVAFILQYTGVLIAQDKGMKFFEGSWDELMATAKKLDKPVFVDVYTTWCGPCKLMAKNIFPLEAVGNKYNNAFINYKLDAEAGEGMAIAKKYMVNSYPTYLYIKNDGELVHKGGGYHPDYSIFISEADKALQAVADPYTVGKMAADFKNGKRDTSFLKTYISKLTQLEMDNTEALDAYFALLSKKEKLQSSTLSFLVQNTNSVSSQAFSHVMKNIKGVFDVDGDDKPQRFGFQNKLANLLQQDVAKSMQNGNLQQVRRSIEYSEKIPGLDPFFKDYFDKQKLQYLDKMNKVPELIAATDKFLADISSLTVEQVIEENDRHFNAFMQPYLNGQADSTKDESFGKMREYVQKQHINTVADKYYSAALHFYNRVKKKDQLERALTWSRKAAQLVPDSKPYRQFADDLNAVYTR